MPTLIEDSVVNARDAIVEITGALSDTGVEQLLDYARFLSLQGERSVWQDFGRRQLALAYGGDEPEYTQADLRDRRSHWPHC